ncbi:MAG: hypothetical protein ABIL12_01275 [candidate division WOR-3 bacterium]
MKRSYLPQKVEEMLEKLGDGEKEILLLSSNIARILGLFFLHYPYLVDYRPMGNEGYRA